jgi:hypothetical protein
MKRPVMADNHFLSILFKSGNERQTGPRSIVQEAQNGSRSAPPYRDFEGGDQRRQ